MLQFKALRVLVVALVAAGLSLTAQGARAAFTLNVGNADIQGVTGNGANQLQAPYATLTIVGDTNTGQVTFTLTTSAHNANAPINAVFNDISFNTSLALNSDFTLLSATNGGTIGNGGNVSSLGSFDYTVGGNGAAARDHPYVFVLQMVDFSDALASNFAETNEKGNLFAAHIFTDIGRGGTTGFIGGGTTTNVVPAPAGLILLASAVPVFAMRRLVRRKQAA
jgi:hypothetical protein